jgi:hypothetical protein
VTDPLNSIDIELELPAKLLTEGILYLHLENSLLWEKPEQAPFLASDPEQGDFRLLAIADCIRGFDEKYNLKTTQYFSVLEALKIDRRKHISDELHIQIETLIELGKLAVIRQVAEVALSALKAVIDTAPISKKKTSIALAKENPVEQLARLRRLTDLHEDDPFSSYFYVYGLNASDAEMPRLLGPMFGFVKNWNLGEIASRRSSIFDAVDRV